MVVADGGAGPAEREFVRLGMYYSVTIRAGVVAVSSLVSLFTEAAPRAGMDALVIVSLNVWNIVLAYAVVRGRKQWIFPVDVAVICAVCVAQSWTTTTATRDDGTGWVLTMVAVVVATYQWFIPAVPGIIAGVLVTGAYVAGTALVNSAGWVEALPHGLWNVMTAVLARGLFTLIRQGSRNADKLLRSREQIRQESAVAAARRADERDYLAALHDTASATLLMVGAGVVQQREAWLAEQATRDLEVIRGQADASDIEVDLVEMLRDVVQLVPLQVEWRAAEAVSLPAVVAVAVSHGTREALTNVIRHAEVDAAAIAVYRDGETVAIEVSDEGKGFDPRRTPEHRYGVTRSLIARMARLGGRASVLSRPGAGTLVRMEWPDERS